MDAENFLDLIFQDLEPEEHVCVSRATPKKDGKGNWFKNYLITSRQWRKWAPDAQAQAWYFCVSTINGELNDKATMVGRGRGNLRRFHCLVLDDIGTKASEPPVRPSWILESSPGNYQWGYLLDPGDNWGRYEALVEYCHQQGWGDAGAGGSYRLMRVPGSANIKPGRQNFRSVVRELDDAVWSLDELAEDLGCDFDKIEVKLDAGVLDRPSGVTAMDGIDPMLDWLTDAGHVVRDDGGQWVDIVCPWHEQHTSGENTAGYSPLGRGTGKFVQTRAFKCLHEHCVDRKLTKFREWASKQGSPSVSGFDPLPWLQDKYTYVETGQMVYDLAQRPVGGVWSWTLADWKLKHPGRMTVPGREAPILIANAFIEHDDTKKAVATTYLPVSRGHDIGLIEKHGQSFVNTYVPPNWAETDEPPLVFLEHMDYLIPDKFERETFLSWLAYKIQHPASRSYACVMVAEDAYGTGRSWIGRIIGRMLQGHVNKASLPQLIGKGTSAEQNYNNWMVDCQFIIVEEAKDSGLTRDDFYHGYETFKQNVEPGEAGEAIRVNDKYGRTREAVVYFNPLIFTNHADAMVLEEGDRRLFAVENPTERKDYTYYDRLAAALNTQEPRRLFWWLMRRDLTGFDHIYPPMTPTKARMIEDTRPPSDTISDWVRGNHAPDLVTRETLRGAIILAAREHDYEKIMREPGGVLKMLWRKLKTLRPEDTKNGARYVINNKQTEVRAIRNQIKWMKYDARRDAETIENEFMRTELSENVVLFRGKEET